MYDLVRVSGWKLYELHGLLIELVSWVGSVLHRFCIRYHNNVRLGSTVDDLPMTYRDLDGS